MDKLVVGYAANDLVPPLPFPLAGTVTMKERLAGWVMDPVKVYCTAFRQGSESALLIALDLLVVDQSLMDSVNAIAVRHGFKGVYLHASHTHSSMGGYLDSRAGKFFMGRYRPALNRFLVDTVERTVKEASESMSQVHRIRFGRTEVPGLTMNRRKKGGPTDDAVMAVELRRRQAPPVLLVGVSGHPVIVMVYEPEAVSADYPGRVAGHLRSEGYCPLVMTGGLGGLNILFPEMSSPLEGHISLVSSHVVSGVERALKNGGQTRTPALRFLHEPLEFRMQFPPLSGGPPPVAARSLLTAALGYAYARASSPERVTACVPVLDLGPAALAGMPADFGVTATRLLRDRLEAAGCPCPIVTSHTNGFVGYLHLPDEHAWQPESETGFLHYENAMNWYGHDSCDRVMDAAQRIYGKSSQTLHSV